MQGVFKHKMGGREQEMKVVYADILQKLGRGTYMTRDMQAQARRDDKELSALRAEYQETVGKRPYHGWDADTLREKIAEARAE